MSPTARFLRGGCRRFGLYALVVALFLLWPAFRDVLALLGLFLRIRHRDVAVKATAGEESCPILVRGRAAGQDEEEEDDDRAALNGACGERGEQQEQEECPGPDESAQAGNLGMGACFPPTGPDRVFSAWTSAQAAIAASSGSLA